MAEKNLEFYQGAARIHPHAFGYRACGVVPDPGLPSYVAHRRWEKDRLAPVPAYPYRNTSEEWTHNGDCKEMPGKYWYFGVMDQHFGHFITESLPRIWWHLNNPGHGRRPVIVQYGTGKNWDGQKTKLLPLKSWQKEILDYFGIKNPLYVYRPMSFEDIVIPEQGALLFSAYHSSYYQNTLAQYDISINGERKYNDKIFVRRPETVPPAGLIGELAFEEMLVDAGYKVISPETLGFSEQIQTVRNASHVIGSEGSALHLWNVLGKSPQTKMLALQRLGGVTNEGFTSTISPYLGEYKLVQPAARIRTAGGSNKDLVIPDIEKFKNFLIDFDQEIDITKINYEYFYSSFIKDLSISTEKDIILNLI